MPIVTRGVDVTGTPVVLGANIDPLLVPDNAIVHNLEQARSGWVQGPYLDLLRRSEVWDYSIKNIVALRQAGVVAECLPVGYEPCLTRIKPAIETIDVLFYGSIFGRRLAMLDSIRATGLRVHMAFGVYGKDRDDLIARSKIVLNLHAYDEDGPFETVRVSYLLANQKLVISERSPDVPIPWRNGIVFGAAVDLPEICKHYANDETRRAIARRGFQAFTSVRQSEYLRPLITAR